MSFFNFLKQFMLQNIPRITSTNSTTAELSLILVTRIKVQVQQTEGFKLNFNLAPGGVVSPGGDIWRYLANAILKMPLILHSTFLQSTIPNPCKERRFSDGIRIHLPRSDERLRRLPSTHVKWISLNENHRSREMIQSVTSDLATCKPTNFHRAIEAYFLKDQYSVITILVL